MRRHVQRMRDPGRDRSVGICCPQSARGERGIIVTVDKIMGDAGMVRILGPKLFEDFRRRELVRQASVVRRGVADGQTRQS